MTLTVHGATAGEVMTDVYFRDDFVALHARPDRVDRLNLDGFRHIAAVREIPGTDLEDLETPWGYGGPVARDEGVFWQGIGLWKQRQIDNNRVAEFVRLHPFLNPMNFRGWFDHLRLDRLTILVDLWQSATQRWRYYNKGTRYSIRQAQRHLRIRPLMASEAHVFKHCYEAGLSRNEAEHSYYFSDGYFTELLGSSWAKAWVAELQDEPIAVACFIHGGPFAHYHLSGGDVRSREQFAHYGLLETALQYFADHGFRWLHLGGGRSRESQDALLMFKAKFSPHRIPFYVGGIVYARDAYEKMTHGRNERVLSYRFPPAPDVGAKPISLRSIKVEDFTDFFRLKCDVDNIAWSGYDKPPDWFALSQWFDSKVAPNSSRRIYLAEFNGQILGYTYVDDHGEALEITIGVASRESGRGLGRNFLRQVMAEIDPPKKRVECWIFLENLASIKAFEAAGFKRDDSRGSRSFPMPSMVGATLQYCWVYRPDGRDQH